MKETGFFLEKGVGRAKVTLWARQLGGDLLFYIYNENAHLGAVAISEFDAQSARSSTSVITLLGHKDDQVAYGAASLICKKKKRPTCVIAGIHVDNITKAELKMILSNAKDLVRNYCDQVD